MPRIYVSFAGLEQVGNQCKSVSLQVGEVRSDLLKTVRRLDWDVRYESDINSTAKQIARKLENYSNALKTYQSFLRNAEKEYVKLNTLKQDGRWKIFADEFSSNFGWKEILSGAGYIGEIYNFINDIRNGKSWLDFCRTGVKIYQFLSGAAKTFNNYMKIGRVVGSGTAMTWWAKAITGLKPLGRASTAKNPVARFINNLTNKTSPFNAQLKNVVNNFKGANGIGKAIASWAGVLLTGVTNAFSNIEEQKASNGTMSTGRVIAETITETVIDTALTYGAGIVVGAAVTTVLGTAAAPGIIVVAATGAIMAGLNAGVKALTGKRTTEWISDFILDRETEIIGSAVNRVTKSIGNWFGKLSFAI